MRIKYILCVVSLLLFSFITACDAGNDVVSEDIEKQELESSERAEVEVSEFGEEVGLSLNALDSEVNTILLLEGTIQKANELNEDFLWVTIRKIDHIEEIPNKEFDHYIQIENGHFSEELNLHHGEGDYRVTVRLPSIDEGEKNKFYDVAKFKVNNKDEEIARDVEYSLYGLEKELKLSDSIKGWNQAEETIEIEGTVSANYKGNILLAEVKKDGEKNKITIPIQDGTFKGEIPLYYGKGTHSIQLQLMSDREGDRDGSYYDSAVFYVNNESDKIFPEITQYASYIESGITIESPGWDIETKQDSIEYLVKGQIDKNAPRAEDISHVIVQIQHLDDRKDEATYYIPVENHAFEGITHFRFGPGEYEVTIHVPEGKKEEQGKGSKFYFTPVLSIKHEVVNVDDKRDILPSRGIESDHRSTIEKAKEITSGITDEREKAKAIYEFVAKHVAYDVEKFKEDIFHPDDSALKTLDTGMGICQDYAFLTIALLRSIDIEARYVRGIAGGRHAWVEANIGGQWIEMDPTWGAGYVDRAGEFHFEYNEEYFDPDPDFLEETHRRQGLMY